MNGAALGGGIGGVAGLGGAGGGFGWGGIASGLLGLGRSILGYVTARAEAKAQKRALQYEFILANQRRELAIAQAKAQARVDALKEAQRKWDAAILANIARRKVEAEALTRAQVAALRARGLSWKAITTLIPSAMKWRGTLV